MRFLVLLLILSSGCANRPALPELGTVPPVTLTTDAGTPLDLSSLKGNVAVYDFVFTRCSATCPVMTSAMKRVARRLQNEKRIRFISVSVDPSYDTPEVLRRYADAIGRDPRWIWTTGDRDAVIRLSIDGFKLAAGSPQPGGEGLLHSSKFVLADANGEIRGYYDALSEQSLDTLVSDAERLLKESKDVS